MLLLKISVTLAVASFLLAVGTVILVATRARTRRAVDRGEFAITCFGVMFVVGVAGILVSTAVGVWNLNVVGCPATPTTSAPAPSSAPSSAPSLTPAPGKHRPTLV